MTKVLITPRSLSAGTHPKLKALENRGYALVYPTPGATPQEADLIKVIPGCIGWIAGVEPVSDAVINAADKLVAISRNGTGIDNLPMEAINARGIIVKRAQGTNARGVAELALSLIRCRYPLRSMAPRHRVGNLRCRNRYYWIGSDWSRTGRDVLGPRCQGHRV